MADVESLGGLSLLADFDDLNRYNSVLNDGVAEEYFLRFLEIQSQWQIQLTNAVTEAVRLQKELQDSLKSNSILESKLSHARKLFDNERKHRLRAEHEKEALEKKIVLTRDLLFNDNRDKLNNETLEKLAFLNNASVSKSTHIGVDNILSGRLNTITELNSTGNLLSDQSFSRSEDDLDVSLVHGRRSWKRHRPSVPSVPPSVPISEDHSSAKKRCSGEPNKVEAIGNANKIIATTTVTVDRCATDGLGNGRITASSVIEGVVNECDGDSEIPISVQPTPKSAKTGFIKISKNNHDEIYSFSNKKNTHTDSIKTAKESDREWPQSPRGPIRPRQHTFSTKMIIRPEECTACGIRMTFAKSVLKCSDCRAICHVSCREKLPLPCIPSHTTPNTNANYMGTIADYTPNVTPMIPALIIHCVNEIEARGLTEVGIYRIPGSEKEVKLLKERFLKNKGTPPLMDIDIHVICGCVKMFLKSLREPLVTYSLWPDFVSATQMIDQSDGDAALFQAISELPQPNRDTLAFMMLHLQRVAECVECKMPLDNLAKVFGPTIVGYSDYDPHPNDMYQQTIQQYTVMQRLLNISSDYWARFTAIVGSDGSSVIATPPLCRTPSVLRTRINTMPTIKHAHSEVANGVSADGLSWTPSITSSSKSGSSHRQRGFFYTPKGGKYTK